MTTLHIEVGEAVFEFSSQQHWINKAQSWFMRHQLNSETAVAVDAHGRLCRIGKDFADAEQDQAYPVKVFRYRPAAAV